MRNLFRLSSRDDDAGDGRGTGRDTGSSGRLADDLPYRVELWDLERKAIEQILAITSSGSIGYAAYHAATVEFPDRYIVLRHRQAVLSRFNGPSH